MKPFQKMENLDLLFREQLDKIRNEHNDNGPLSVHNNGEFDFRDNVWPDTLNKSGSA